jgi:hypothetical protein
MDGYDRKELDSFVQNIKKLNEELYDEYGGNSGSQKKRNKQSIKGIPLKDYHLFGGLSL